MILDVIGNSHRIRQFHIILCLICSHTHNPVYLARSGNFAKFAHTWQFLIINHLVFGRVVGNDSDLSQQVCQSLVRTGDS